MFRKRINCTFAPCKTYKPLSLTALKYPGSMGLMESIRNKARQAGKTIVLPEGTEERTLKAADFILKEQIAHIILLGDPERIKMLADDWGLENISKAVIINPENNPRRKEFAGLLYEIRKHKGLSMEEAEVLVEDPLYLATLLIKKVRPMVK
jgi:phosphate acetyltransferase